MNTNSQLHASTLIALSLTVPLLSGCTDELVAATPQIEPAKNIMQLDGCLDPVVLPTGFNASQARKPRIGARYKWSTLDKAPYKIEGVLVEGIDSVTIQVNCWNRYKDPFRISKMTCKKMATNKNNKIKYCEESRVKDIFVQKGSGTSLRYPGKIGFGLDIYNKYSHVEMILLADLANESKASLEFDRLTAQFLK